MFPNQFDQIQSTYEYSRGEHSDVNLDLSLYDFILSNVENFNPIHTSYLLGHHELNIMARFIQRKFPDSRYSIGDIKRIMIEELKEK